MSHRIVFVSAQPKLTLAARIHDDILGWDFGVTEHDMNLIQEWCDRNNCGTRISFDMIKFKTREQMTMFLLKWSNHLGGT